MSEAYEYLKKIIPEDRIFLNESMSAHTTFRTGGNVKALVTPVSEDEIVTLVSYLKKLGIEYFIKGNGSNLLVSDKGYDGIVIELNRSFSDISVSGDVISARAGTQLSQIANVAYENALTGFEFASGIPGTIGGGVVMNAGAYDGELKDIIKTVRVLDGDGEILTLDNSDMEFGYRTSILKKRDLIVLSAEIKLTGGDKDKIKEKMSELNVRRREKQPLELPSAGSTFKRPEGYFAGKLIMDAGLRGYSIGGAAVSEKHCGFIVNKGKASSVDIYELICEVREKVNERFGVMLEPEIVFLGEF